MYVALPELSTGRSYPEGITLKSDSIGTPRSSADERNSSSRGSKRVGRYRIEKVSIEADASWKMRLSQKLKNQF